MRLNVNGTARDVEAPDEMPLLWVLRDVLPVSAVGGRMITTIEGLSPDGSHPVQKAWAEADVVQCGYCQPGQIMQAAALLAQNPNPTDEDVDLALAGNICRCGTYQRIREAVQKAAKSRRAER